MPEPQPKIIVIRRDNIGDLVCTTPFFSALRQRFPHAQICALVNSYNVDVLTGNPNIDKIYAYTKAKHRAAGESLCGVYWDRVRLFAALRRERFDYAIIAGAGFVPRALRLARLLRPRHIIGFTEPGKAGVQHIDRAIPYSLTTPLHETEDIFRLLAPLGISGTPPPLCVLPNQDQASKVRAELARISAGGRTLGIHISARKVSQRWPTENFIEFIRQLRAANDARFLLLWSPGAENNPLHPGDDQKAAEIMRALSDVPCLAFPTHTLKDLIAALSVCDLVACSDGGAMHLAAALGKPVMCFFGKSDAQRWHPWGVPHRVLQTPSREVSDIAPSAALAAYAQLVAELHWH